MQYTINNNVIKEFNKTIKNVEHNELILRTRIDELTEIIDESFEAVEILTAKDLYNQLIIMYNTLLNILQEIENSLTFCHLRTYHPSILTTDQLYEELKKISEHYGKKLPIELKMEKMPDLQRLISVDCRLENNKIIYLLSMPINFDIEFDLFYLLPIPSKSSKGYVTILPSNKYFLMYNHLVKSLDSICIQSRIFQCSSSQLNNNVEECELRLLQKEDTTQCQYVNLEIPRNYLEIIPEINQLLIVFPKEELIKFQCPSDKENKKLDGIFLIEQNDCKFIYKDEHIEFEQSSRGKPILIDSLNLADHNFTLSKSKIILRNLRLNEMTLNQLQPLENESNHVNILFYLTFKILSISCSILLIGFFALLGFKFVKGSQKLVSETSQAYPDIEP
uniref:Envelope protein n=1 Tax=Cacopsylla melanoneura TaxID=428564 RepID=A0A8D9BKZ6_9HEMI